jgi:hypothetical protein
MASANKVTVNQSLCDSCRKCIARALDRERERAPLFSTLYICSNCCARSMRSFVCGCIRSVRDKLSASQRTEREREINPHLFFLESALQVLQVLDFFMNIYVCKFAWLCIHMKNYDRRRERERVGRRGERERLQGVALS